MPLEGVDHIGSFYILFCTFFCGSHYFASETVTRGMALYIVKTSLNVETTRIFEIDHLCAYILVPETIIGKLESSLVFVIFSFPNTSRPGVKTREWKIFISPT